MYCCRYTHPTVIVYLEGNPAARPCHGPGLLFGRSLAPENAMSIRCVMSCVGALLVLLATTPGALCYIHFPPKTLKDMCKQSHRIRLLKIDKASREKGVIVFQLVESLKGGASHIASLKHVLRANTAGVKPIREWMASGKSAIMFSIEGRAPQKRGLAYVFIDNFCYSVDYDEKDQYWLVIRGEASLSACYHGSVEQLRKAIKETLDGKTVKVPVEEPKVKEDPEKRREEINDYLKKYSGK
jgi:hypothetical protein